MSRTYNQKELINLGFEYIQEDGTPYFQLVANRDKYFESTFITAEPTSNPEEYIVKDGDKELSEDNLAQYIASNGIQENFTADELRQLGFVLYPLKDTYKMRLEFEPDREDSKFLETEEISLTVLREGTLKVVNNVNKAKNGFNYLVFNQIKKLVERGGF